MRFHAVVLAGALASCGVPTYNEPTPPVPRRPAIPLQPHTMRLPNGITAILVADPNADLASVLVRYSVGSIDEPAGQGGVAHVAAHVSYAPLTGQLTLWDRLDRVGTWINTIPDSEHTDFTVQCEPQQLADVLAIEADRLARRCETVDDAWFTWLRQQVTEEVRANVNRNVQASIANTLYPAPSPYRSVYTTSPTSIQAVTHEQTCRFMDEHYAPANVAIVVSGPFDPAAFERVITANLAAVPSRTPVRAATRGAKSASGFRTQVTTEVAEPTLAIAWPLSRDPKDRSITLFAADLLARTVKSRVATDDNHVILWLSDNSSGVDATIAKVRATLAAGLIAPKDFEQTRTAQITRMLARLDSITSRLDTVADQTDLDAPFEALDRVSVQGFDAIVAKAFDWSQARVIELRPDGTRPLWHPASMGDPAHSLRGPSMFPVGIPIPTAATNRALAHARTFQLANGMTVILAPTSPVPLVEMRLAFAAGTAAEPPTHHGTAAVAIAAFEQVASRGAHSEAASWTATKYSGASFDSSGIGVRGPTMYLDLLMNQFEGLAESSFQQLDVLKGHEAFVKAASSPLHHVWDEAATVRATVHGSDHPYAQAKMPGVADIANFDAREVETFYRRYLQPNNATLVVTGGFDVDEATKQVHRVFDGWQGKGEAVSPGASHGAAAHYAASDKSALVTLRIEWRGGALDTHYEARGMLAAMLGAISGQVNAVYVPRRSGGTYVLQAKLDPTAAPREIHGIVDSIPEVGAGHDRYRSAFATARLRATRALLGGGRSVGGWSSWILFAVANGRDVAWLAGMPARSASVTYDEVARLATAELALDAATFFISGPHDAVAAVYAELGITPTWIN